MTSKPVAVGWQRLLFLLIASNKLKKESVPSNAAHAAFSCPQSLLSSQKDEDAGAVITD